MPPKRAWNKQIIIQWLNFHQLNYSNSATKAELLEIAFENVPAKKYLVDEAAQIYNVDIIRLPVKHCSLNSIELGWAGMKAYIRDNNTNFCLPDVERLASEWIAAVDEATAQSYIAHAHQHELVFKQTDAFAEEVEDQLIDDEDEDQLTSYESDDETNMTIIFLLFLE
ncbi:unnamed protein product [Didymodactylos carnosus]|uniref:Uncharacterized protein n=1 Tax=Didymodactylos carnosus TaxID=1234261 RepID=A0A814XT83_9BILA|nr:unnamed protein product [Didymodactylos carnosus]CAF1220030.1 unnamed protein product [Didymodactylos carnosus]CAF3610770.1 unnamed protein product [Didymodactylos carnosus]CAF3983524.1 unnamed protein product [Didymodactylos carnosus]